MMKEFFQCPDCEGIFPKERMETHQHHEDTMKKLGEEIAQLEKAIGKTI